MFGASAMRFFKAKSRKRPSRAAKYRFKVSPSQRDLLGLEHLEDRRLLSLQGVSLPHATSGNSIVPGINHNVSDDGRYVVFYSLASDLVAGDTNGLNDVFVRDMQTGALTLVSQGIGGPANGTSVWSSISADGRYIVEYQRGWTLHRILQ
jgi:hypothetical protein